MNKVLVFLLVLVWIPCFSTETKTAISHGCEYTIKKFGTEAFDLVRWENITSINSRGQVLGAYYEDHKQTGGMYLLDVRNGVFLIAMDQNQISGRLWPVALNNCGQILSNGYKRTGGYGACLWSKSLGFYWLNVFDSKHSIGIAFNDLGQIIGTYRPNPNSNDERAFLWNNGVVSDMGPESSFGKQLESYGYHVMDVRLTSINNRGEFAGFFACGKYNEMKKKYIVIGYLPFFWDGDAHIIFLNNDNPLKYPPTIQLNNRSLLMIRLNEDTYLWDTENNARLIGFLGDAINDNGVILGRSKHKILLENCEEWENPLAIWRDGNVITLTELLGIRDLRNISTPFSDTYSIESLSGVFGINNKNEIVGEGIVWGESHPLVISPEGSE